MTHAERIYNYLWSIAPDSATNGQLARQLGIASQQTVYMVTQELLRRGMIRGEQSGRTWRFYAVEPPYRSPTSAAPAQRVAQVSGGLTPQAFETLARRILGDHYGVALSPGSVPGVPKLFDLVSPDGRVVGDAKYYARVGPARFSVIAEHVWLLEKTGAPETFLVFGNDRETPQLWLQRYGSLVFNITFYFLTDDGRLESLNGLDDAVQ
ncbi:MAG: hypothetical protein M3Q65_16940 [Chloroflexota bacterium]|nr:hypothetical protein [Chloroflexota bacterium]